MEHILKHIAIIPDGNRTWATDQGLLGFKGHQAGYIRTKEILEYLFQQLENIVGVTFWALSTENMKKRSEEERALLFQLLETGLTEIEPILKKHDLGFLWLGDRAGISVGLVKKLDALQVGYPSAGKKTVNLLLNYGGKRHMQHALEQCIANGESDMHKYMKLGDLPPVDMIVRTKGAIRTSGFLPWEDYAEWYFTDLKYPDFTVEKLQIAIQDRHSRKRNFGA